MTKTVDQWAAAQCGAKVTKFDPDNDQLEQYWEYKGKTYDGKWTMEFADCREIMRWKFGISTEICFDSITGNLRGVRGVFSKGSDSTDMKSSIPEAEKAAITAIYEASQ